MKLQIYLKNEQYEELKETADNIGVSVSALVKFKLFNGENKIKKNSSPVNKLEKYVAEYVEANPNCEIYVEGDYLVMKYPTGTVTKTVIPTSILASVPEKP